MENLRKYIFSAIVIAIALPCAFYFGREKKPIKIGFIGSLTGEDANWGVDSRNGAILALESVNAAGGISGHPVRLITRDDKMDSTLAAQAVRDLSAEGVCAIIGTTASQTAMKAVPAANELKMLMIGPTVSTDALTGIDDMFIRNDTRNSQLALTMAVYVFEKRGWRRVVPVFITNNDAYAQDVFKSFNHQFKKLGGTVLPLQAYPSGARYADIVKKLGRQSADGVYLVAGDIDSAYFCQEIRKQGAFIPVAESGAAVSKDLIRQGGIAVEGFLTAGTFYKPKDEKYNEFKKRFKDRYGKDPLYAASRGYDSATVMVEALKQSREWTGLNLKKTILDIQRFESPAGDFEIDKYGDTTRKISIVTVKNGQFVFAQ